jgi:hypothetical protein
VWPAVEKAGTSAHPGFPHNNPFPCSTPSGHHILVNEIPLLGMNYLTARAGNGKNLIITVT